MGRHDVDHIQHRRPRVAKSGDVNGQQQGQQGKYLQCQRRHEACRQSMIKEGVKVASDGSRSSGDEVGDHSEVVTVAER